MHGGDDAPEFQDRQSNFGGDAGDLGAQILDVVPVLLDEFLPALAGKAANAVDPVGIQFVAVILLQEIGALDLGRHRQTQQSPFKPNQAPVQIIHMTDQIFDPVIVEVDTLHQLDQLVAQFFEPLLGRRRQLLAGRDGAEPLVVGPVHLGVAFFDDVELAENFRQ